MNSADSARSPAAARLRGAEQARLAALARYGGLVPLAEATGSADSALVQLAEQARREAGLDIGVVALVGSDQQRILAGTGAGAPDLGLVAGARLPRDQVVGLDAFELRSTLVAYDATTDPNLRTHPLVERPDGIRSCLGAPIVTPDGHAIGMVLALGLEARPRFDGLAVARLWMLAAGALDLLTPTQLAQAS